MCGKTDGKFTHYTLVFETNLVVEWSEVLITDREVPGLIPGSATGIFLKGAVPMVTMVWIV
jgi:hypothetical protein